MSDNDGQHMSPRSLRSRTPLRLAAVKSMLAALLLAPAVLVSSPNAGQAAPVQATTVNRKWSGNGKFHTSAGPPALAVAGPPTHRTVACTGTAWVANSGFGVNSVSVIDAGASPPSVSATVPVGNIPVGVTASPDGSTVWVANSSSGTVSVIDATTSPPAVSATVTVGSNPRAVAVSPDGSTVWVTNQNSGTVSVIDAAASPPAVSATVPVGTQPYGVAVSPDGSTVWVTNSTAGTVSVIDTSASPPVVSATVPVGGVPYGVAVSPDGSTVWVTDSLSGTVSVIDATASAVTATVPVGSYPFEVAVSPDGSTVWVTNLLDSTVSVIDATASAVTATVSTGNFPAGLAVSPDGSTVWVTNLSDGTVSVIDATAPPPAVTATVSVGTEPYDVAVGCIPTVAAPTVTSVAPTSGPTAGGTPITIVGTGFVAGATVTVGATACASVVIVDPTEITCMTPAGSVGAVDVVVVNPDTQTATRVSAFTYVAAPTVTSVAPTSGPTAGGTPITTVGTGFVAAAPTVTSVAPTSGPTAGGTSITIVGTGFVAGATVTVGATACASVVIVDPTKITCMTPAGSAGAVDVVVANPDSQTATRASAFTYVAAPTITSDTRPDGPQELPSTGGGDWLGGGALLVMLAGLLAVALSASRTRRLS